MVRQKLRHEIKQYKKDLLLIHKIFIYAYYRKLEPDNFTIEDDRKILNQARRYYQEDPSAMDLLNRIEKTYL